MAVGTEAKETGQERHLNGGKGMGEDTLSKPKSLGGDDEEEDEDGEEGEVTPPPNFVPPKDLPSLGDIFSQQARITISVSRPKQPRTETMPSTSPLP
jgi:hypothetical protein